MKVTQVGIVYYADDPDKKIFRMVYPEFDDSELDYPATDHNRRTMVDANGKALGWHEFNVDPKRTAVFEKVLATDPRVLAGMTGTV